MSKTCSQSTRENGKRGISTPLKREGKEEIENKQLENIRIADLLGNTLNNFKIQNVITIIIYGKALRPHSLAWLFSESDVMQR